MGDPTDTQTQLRHRFLGRYGDFRDELKRPEKAAFDELLLAACRSATALNRKADMDFERPMLLAMLVSERARHDETRRQLAGIRADLNQARRALDEHGLLPDLRRVRPERAHLDRVGQARLTHDPARHPLPGQLPRLGARPQPR